MRLGSGLPKKPPLHRSSQQPKISKAAANANFGMNMPMMSSAFDTAMWLNAA